MHKRSVLTGQPLPPAGNGAQTPLPDEPPGGSQPPHRKLPGTPFWMTLGGLLVLIAAITLVAVWQAQPGALPFVPPPPTHVPAAAVIMTPTPPSGSTPREPFANPAGLDPARDLQSVRMLAGGFGWGRGLAAIWRTDDGGETWLNVTPPLPSPDLTIDSVFFHSRLNAWFLVDGAGGRIGVEKAAALYRTGDGGFTWRVISVPFQQAELFFLDSAAGWALGQGVDGSTQALFRTNDGGATWVPLPAAGEGDGALQSLGLTFSDAQNGWLVLQNESRPANSLVATIDGGRSWRDQMLMLPAGYVFDPQQPLARPPAFFGSNYGPGVLPANAVEARPNGRQVQVFFVSEDGGRSWKPTTPTQRAAAVSIPNWRVLYLVDENGILHRSIDAGRTWNTAPGGISDSHGSGLRLQPEGIDFNNTAVGWAWQVIAGEFLLFTSTDGGDTWSKIDYSESPAAAAARLEASAESGLVDASLQGGESGAACRWEPATFAPTLLKVTEEGPYRDWRIYINPVTGLALKVPPGWNLDEIVYDCTDRERSVHRVRIYPGDTGLAQRPVLTIAFRHPEDAVALRHPAAKPAGLATRGSADLFWKQVPRLVLDTGGSRQAIYYNGGDEIAIGSAYLLTATFEAAYDPAGPGLDFDHMALAERVLASIAPLSSNADILSAMNVETTFSESPDGQWEAEVLLALPVRGTLDYDYRRVTVRQKGSTAQYTAIDEWARFDATSARPTGFVWSPDGRYLYLYNTGSALVCPVFSRHENLRRLDLETGQVEDLNLYSGGYLANLELSPAVDRVAFLPPDYLLDPRIVIRDLDSGQETALEFFDPQLDHWGAGDIRWSPDGSRLVFAIAGPYCGQDETEKRMIVLVDLASSSTRIVAGPDRWLTISKWQSDGRLRLADRSGRLFSLNLESGEMDSIPPDPADRVLEAEQHLRGFFNMLYNTWNDAGTWLWAAEHYAGGYVELERLNPDVDPNDRPLLLQRACEQNGYYCLRIRRVIEREIVAKPAESGERLFRFKVELQNDDGTLFNLRGQTVFDYTVNLRPDGIYRVMELPPK